MWMETIKLSDIEGKRFPAGRWTRLLAGPRLPSG